MRGESTATFLLLNKKNVCLIFKYDTLWWERNQQLCSVLLLLLRRKFYQPWLLRDLVAPKGAVCLCWQTGQSNRQIRTEYGLVVSERTPHPWLSQSFSWRARCMSQHHGSRSQGKLWEHHESLRRSGQRFAWHRHGEQDDGWLAWWCLGCYHEGFFGDAWRLLFLNLCLLYRDQTCCLLVM